ncbi:MAG: glycosyltransferase [Candidatus Omnitrophica bacterium]|nr:glycosyltransferase [Candidatus Omnitrophota bacterium]
MVKLDKDNFYNKKRILVLTPCPSILGGSERAAVSYVKHFKDLGAEVFFCFEKKDNKCPVDDYCQQKGIPYLNIPIAHRTCCKIKRLFLIITQSLLTVFFLIRQKPDAIQIVLPWLSSGPHLLIAARILNIPTNLRFSLVCSENKSNTPGWHVRLFRWAFKGRQIWNTLSFDNRCLIAEILKLDKDKIKVISNAYNPKLKELSQKPHGDLARSLGIGDNVKLLLTVARFTYQKGYKHIIYCLPALLREFEDICFVWAGCGELYDEYKACIKALGLDSKVFFLGYRSDIMYCLKQADLFIYPTESDGSPNILFEAVEAR